MINTAVGSHFRQPWGTVVALPVSFGCVLYHCMARKRNVILQSFGFASVQKYALFRSLRFLIHLVHFLFPPSYIFAYEGQHKLC